MNELPALVGAASTLASSSRAKAWKAASVSADGATSMARAMRGKLLVNRSRIRGIVVLREQLADEHIPIAGLCRFGPALDRLLAVQGNEVPSRAVSPS